MDHDRLHQGIQQQSDSQQQQSHESSLFAYDDVAVGSAAKSIAIEVKSGSDIKFDAEKCAGLHITRDIIDSIVLSMTDSDQKISWFHEILCIHINFNWTIQQRVVAHIEP